MTEDTDTLLRRLERAWNDQDIETIASLFTDDCVYEDFAEQAYVTGPDGVRQFAAAVYSTMPDFSLTLRRIGTGPTHGVSEWTITATWRGEFEGVDRTGTRVEFSGLSMFEFADGRIRRNSDCWDYTVLAKQMRVLPERLREVL